MQHYELLVILSSKLDQAGEEAAVKKTLDLIAKHQGKVTRQESLGKHKLAYEIKHETYGSYVCVEFDMEQPQLKEVDRQFRLMAEAVRHLIIKKPVKTAAQIAEARMVQEKVEQRMARERAEEKIAAAPPPPAEEPARPKGKDQDKKISLEDLDKKLDDILKEEI
ncbi:MAG: 30S ribosomal protein S6 [Patescibacteria group bacterium]|nr:30S ribosomal protein S6 [Patescibacteria group bacterium]